MKYYVLIFWLELFFNEGNAWSLYMLLLNVLGYEVKSKKQFRRLIIIMAPVMSIGMLCEMAITGSIIYITGMTFLVLLMLYLSFAICEKWWKSLIIAFCSTYIIYFLQILIKCLLDIIVYYSFKGIGWIILFTLSGNVLFTVLMYIVSNVAKRKRKEKIEIRGIILLTIVCIFLMSTISNLNLLGFSDDQYMISRFQTDSEEIYYSYSLIYYTIVLMIIVFLIVMLIYDTKANYYYRMSVLNEHYLEAQKEHYDELVRSNTQIRRIKHDMRNHIFCINELLCSKEYEELEKYIHSLSKELSKADTRVNVGNSIADAIILEKMQQAGKDKIVIEAEGDMSGTDMAAIDLCTILANILDNAIEAVKREKIADASDLEKRKINLSFQKTENFLLITQTNAVAKRVNIVDNTVESSKLEKGLHGFGIANIQSAADRYGGVCDLTCEESGSGYEFKIEVMIPRQANQ